MTFQQNYYHQQLGVMIYNTYWKINPQNGLVGGKDEMNYVIETFKYANASYSENSEVIERQTNNFIPDITGGAKNFIAQAYLHAKSLPYFNSAVDV